MMQIRQAIRADIENLKKFEQGVISAEREFASNLRAGQIHYYDLESLLSNESSVIMVAELNGRLAACGYARIEANKAYFSPNRYAYLGFMYVDPEYRGQGLILSIIESLFTWSKQQGISAFKLDVYAQNQAAIRAYEKLGFKAEMVQMLHFVDQKNSPK